MSVQSMQALPCIGCNNPIYYVQHHVPHCPNTNNHPVMVEAKKKARGKVNAHS